MPGPIVKTTGFFETVAPAIANDGVISQAEALSILDAVRSSGGVAPRELAQAKILKERLYDVITSHQMWPAQVAAQRKVDSATSLVQKAAALVELALANIQVRLMAGRNQEVVDGILANVQAEYGKQWWVHSWVLGVVFGGDANQPTPDSGLDPNGRPIR